METRSNYVMVGAVTLSLLAGVLLFIVWLAGLSNQSSKCYDIYFAQAVSGLNKGSGVTFSGVPVGQVDGLPVGVQLIAPVGGESLLEAAGTAVELL